MRNPFLFVALDFASAEWTKALEECLNTGRRGQVLCDFLNCPATDHRPLAAPIGEALRTIKDRITRQYLDSTGPISYAVHVVLCVSLSGLPPERFGPLRQDIAEIVRLPPPPAGAHGLSLLILHGQEGAVAPGAAASLRDFLQAFEHASCWRHSGWTPQWFWVVSNRKRAPNRDGAEEARDMRDPFLEAMRRLVATSDIQSRNSDSKITRHGVVADGIPQPPLYSTLFSRRIHYPRESLVRWLRLRLAEDLIARGPLRPLADLSLEEADELRFFLGARMRLIPSPEIARFLTAEEGGIRTGLLGEFPEHDVTREIVDKWRDESLAMARRAEAAVEARAAGPLANWREFLAELARKSLSTPAASLDWFVFVMERLKSDRALAPPVIHDTGEMPHPCLNRIHEEVVKPLFFQRIARPWLVFLARAADQLLTGHPSHLGDETEFPEALRRANDSRAALAEHSREPDGMEPTPRAVMEGMLNPVVEMCGTGSVPVSGRLDTLHKDLIALWERVHKARDSQERTNRNHAQDMERRRNAHEELKRRARGLRGLWRWFFHRKQWRMDSDEAAREERALDEAEKAHREKRLTYHRGLRCVCFALQSLLPSLAGWRSVIKAWEQLEAERKTCLDRVMGFRHVLGELAKALERERETLDFPVAAFLMSVPRKEMMPDVFLRVKRENFLEPHNLCLDALIKLRSEPRPLLDYLPDQANAYRKTLEGITSGYFRDLAEMSAVQFLAWYLPHGESIARLQQLIWPDEVIAAPMGGLLASRGLTFFSLSSEDVPEWTERIQASWPGFILPPLESDGASRLDITIAAYIHQIKGSELLLFADC